jgi:hypothetical protein
MSGRYGADPTQIRKPRPLALLPQIVEDRARPTVEHYSSSKTKKFYLQIRFLLMNRTYGKAQCPQWIKRMTSSSLIAQPPPGI